MSVVCPDTLPPFRSGLVLDKWTPVLGDPYRRRVDTPGVGSIVCVVPRLPSGVDPRPSGVLLDGVDPLVPRVTSTNKERNLTREVGFSQVEKEVVSTNTDRPDRPEGDTILWVRHDES